MPVTMGGMLGAFKKLKTRTGSLMAFVTVEDMYGAIECVCFPKVYDKIRNFLETDRVVSLSGKISIDEDKAPVIILDSMREFSIDEPQVAKRTEGSGNTETQPIASREKSDAEKKLWLNITGLDDADVEELMETLTFYDGDTSVFFFKDGKKLVCSQKVTPSRGLFAELASFLSESAIKLL